MKSFREFALCQLILKNTAKQCDERFQKSHIASLFLKTARVSVCPAIVVATNPVDQMSIRFDDRVRREDRDSIHLPESIPKPLLPIQM